MSDLASLRDRVEQVLLDVSNLIYTSNLLDECLRQALHAYSLVLPQADDGTLTLAADGREISLSSLSGLTGVLDVYWPYDSASELWPPNRVRGWRLLWDGNTPYLYLTELSGSQPQSGEKVRVWYVKAQTLKDLDSAASTSVRPEHHTMLCCAAAARAALSRAADLVETTDVDLYQVGLLAAWGRLKERQFESWLEGLRRSATRSGLPYLHGWQLDAWDSR